MRVLFVTSEVAGIHKVGGLGDVSASLPGALAKNGIEVITTLPYHSSIHLNNPQCLGHITVFFENRYEIVFLFQVSHPSTGVPIILFRHPIFDEFPPKDVGMVYALYSQSVAELYKQSERFIGHIDIVHCQDWHTALVPWLIGENQKDTYKKSKKQGKATKTILTIHNLLYQGIVPKQVIISLGKDPELLPSVIDGNIHILRLGIEYADIVTTVSPTYAKEIQTADYGMGLHDIFATRGDALAGILNGIDPIMWDPSTDSSLPATYSSKTASSVRATIKAHLQKTMRLPVNKDILLLGFIGRFDAQQKGVALLLEAIKRLDKEITIQTIFLGTGEKEVEAAVRDFTSNHSTSVASQLKFDETLARTMYAGCDCMVVPSHFEPCGLVQMISMRYGSIPLVRRTGGLADSVEDGVTGFIFPDYSVESLSQGIKRVYDTWKNSAEWEKLIQQSMAQDFSWTKSADEYIILYKSI